MVFDHFTQLLLALSEATNHWLMNIDNGNMNSVVFLDIRKAFDTIDHQILIKKLSQYGIQDDELNFFESYLENRTQCCSVNGKLSDRQKIELGFHRDQSLVLYCSLYT